MITAREFPAGGVTFTRDTVKRDFKLNMSPPQADIGRNHNQEQDEQDKPCEAKIKIIVYHDPPPDFSSRAISHGLLLTKKRPSTPHTPRIRQATGPPLRSLLI
jgi:hypothetical protein